MREHSEFSPIHTILVPLIHEGPGIHALDAARLFEVDVTLVGVVVVPPDQSLSMGAGAARALRRLLRIFGRDKRVTSKSQIIVSYEPWSELSKLVQAEKPDLLCLEYDAHLKALHVTENDVLMRPPCNIALMRGKISSQPGQVLVPVRGGPHAELALRVGLGLHPKGVTTLHLRRSDDPEAGSDAPFKGLDRVLKQMPDVQKQFAVTDDPAQLILDTAKRGDVIILGTTSQPLSSSASLGEFADRILHEAPGAVGLRCGHHPPQ